MTRQWPPILIAMAIFASLSLWMAAASPGFLEADACTHYQYARFALGETHYLVNVWGRPFVTALYSIPATLLGRMGVRATSLVCALLIATIAWRIARDQKYRWPALAFVFTLAQPLVFLHSFSELTELPFALLLTMAFWAYVRREWLVMTIFIALAPTARPEGFGFLVLAAGALMLHRRWWWIALLPVPLLIWTYAGWRVYGRPAYPGVAPGLCWLYWLKHEWPYSQTSTYAAGPLLHFVALLPAIVSPLVFPFLIIGAWKTVLLGNGADLGASADSPPGATDPSSQPSPRSTGEREQRHARACQMLIAAIPLMILTGHSLLYWRGRMASNGEPRYMLTVAPFWALLAASGWEWTFERFHWRHPFLWAGVAALLPALVNFWYPVLPLYLTTDGEKARAVAEWYRDDRRLHTDYPRILACNPEVAYYLGISHTDAGWTRDLRKETVAKAPAGTLFVWDPVYGQANADADRVITLDEIERAGWVERPDLAQPINDVGDGPQWRVFLSPISIFGKRSD
jgi:hypothetical protein